jgi:hypothetical protein
VIDTDVFSADLVPASQLADATRRSSTGPELVAICTYASLTWMRRPRSQIDETRLSQIGETPQLGMLRAGRRWGRDGAPQPGRTADALVKRHKHRTDQLGQCHIASVVAG